MGFIPNDTSNIAIDSVLTDIGRQKLAQGSFNVIKWAAFDDEVDYGMVVRYGRRVGQEKIEKNTPVFEALTNNKLSLVHPLLSLPDPNRYTLTQLALGATQGLSGTTLALGTGASNRQTVLVSQTLAAGELVPQELVDNQFLVVCDDRFLRVIGATGTVDRSRMATYVVSRDGSLTSQGGSVVTLNIGVKSIPDASFTIYGQPTDKTLIRTVVRVTGMTSGTVLEFYAQVTKNA